MLFFIAGDTPSAGCLLRRRLELRIFHKKKIYHTLYTDTFRWIPRKRRCCYCCLTLDAKLYGNATVDGTGMRSTPDSRRVLKTDTDSSALVLFAPKVDQLLRDQAAIATGRKHSWSTAVDLVHSNLKTTAVGSDANISVSSSARRVQRLHPYSRVTAIFTQLFHPVGGASADKRARLPPKGNTLEVQVKRDTPFPLTPCPRAALSRALF